ncbi:hypothetical protein GCM10009836_63400 [Pseudonocardia ailaonensis]|uniref:DUF732 domain-containing protein n=1 Tax=Pseudonocardia ailaonensis TaxID=367279 RepID=A0ABN2NNZ1_9PSEU
MDIEPATERIAHVPAAAPVAPAIAPSIPLPRPSPENAPPGPRSRVPLVLGGVGLLLAGLVLGFALRPVVVGALASSVPAPSTRPAVASAAQATQAAVPATPEQAYVAQVTGTPGLTTSMSEGDLIQVGNSTCQVLSERRYTRADLVARLGQSKLGPQVMGVLVDAAQRNLCPQYTYPAASIPR